MVLTDGFSHDKDIILDSNESFRLLNELKSFRYDKLQAAIRHYAEVTNEDEVRDAIKEQLDDLYSTKEEDY